MEEFMTNELNNNYDAFMKLEEMMYLSLIGKFDYKHVCDNKTYVCFTCTDENVNKDAKLKPVYITGLEIVSDRTARARINAFEKKIFSENFVEFLNRPDDKANICFSRRIKDYVNNIYLHATPSTQKAIVTGYTNNFNNLKNEQILDNAQFEAGVEFVSRQLVKANEKTN